jgi:hypothetical protein
MKRGLRDVAVWKYDLLAVTIYVIFIFGIVLGWNYLSDSANAFVTMH